MSAGSVRGQQRLHGLVKIVPSNYSDSKPSYERMLKEWKLQKNTMGRQKWAAVAVKIQKRRREGKESEPAVYENGIRLDRFKVRREISRHNTALTFRQKFVSCTGNAFSLCNPLFILGWDAN